MRDDERMYRYIYIYRFFIQNINIIYKIIVVVVVQKYKKYVAVQKICSIGGTKKYNIHVRII